MNECVFVHMLRNEYTFNVHINVQSSASLTKTSCYAEDRDENRSIAQNQVNNNNINNGIDEQEISVGI